jgi:hypothetical protein
MLFLLNDTVLDLKPATMPGRLAGRRMRSLSFSDLVRMGQELFAEDPLLQYARPGRAERLATLIMAKAPAINAALFVAPSFKCSASAVQAQFASVGSEVLHQLKRRQLDGQLDMVAADRQVWRRLAA